MPQRPAPTRLSLLLLTATLAISLPLVAGFFGMVHPAFDSPAHFRGHLAALLAVCGVLLAATGPRLNGLVALMLALGALATTLPHGWWGGRGFAHAQEDEQALPVYRLMHLNLRYDNPDHAAVLSLLARERPDVVTFNEVSAPWRERLQAISAAYPYRVTCGHGEAVGGVAILSRRPFFDDGLGHCTADGRFAVASVDFGGAKVHVAALHLGWPWPFEQARQIADLAPVLAALGDHAILAGDFNATPWSMSFRRVVAEGGFEQPRRIGATWLHRSLPSGLRRLAGLPIDHVLTRKGVLPRAVRALGDVGSDHLPVLAEFSLRPEAAPATVAVASR